MAKDIEVKRKRIEQKRKRRAERVRSSINFTSSRVRVSVFRSLKHICAQLIDDQGQKTIAMSTSLQIGKNDLDKKGVAKLVGLDLAKKALEANINEACFDRGHYLYHGRVKSLAEGLREGGLKI